MDLLRRRASTSLPGYGGIAHPTTDLVYSLLDRTEVCFHGQVLSVLHLVVDIAARGRLGGLACGQSLEQIQTLMGPFHERRTDRSPRIWRPRLHFWDDLEVLMCHGMAIGLTVPMWRDTVTLPAAAIGWTRPQPGLLARTDVLAALTSAGISWIPLRRSRPDDTSDVVHIRDSGASLTFGHHQHPDQRRLHSVTVFHPEVDPNDHRPDQAV
jgi:hypothetical protein